MSVPVTGTLEPYSNGNFAVVDQVFTWVLAAGGATIAVASNVADTLLVSAYAGTLHRVDLSAKTGPVGAALKVDILFSTNSGSTWTSLWASTPANKPVIADGAVAGSQAAFDTTTYTAGTLWRIDVLQVGSTTAGSGVWVRLL